MMRIKSSPPVGAGLFASALVGALAGTFIGGPLIYGDSSPWWDGDSLGDLPPSISFEAQEGMRLYPTSFRGCWFTQGGGELGFDDRQERVSFIMDCGEGGGDPVRVTIDPRFSFRDDSWSRSLTVAANGRLGGYYPNATATPLTPAAMKAEVPRPASVGLPRRFPTERIPPRFLETVTGGRADVAPTIAFRALPKYALYPATFRECWPAPDGKTLRFDAARPRVSFVAQIDGVPPPDRFRPSQAAEGRFRAARAPCGDRRLARRPVPRRRRRPAHPGSVRQNRGHRPPAPHEPASVARAMNPSAAANSRSRRRGSSRSSPRRLSAMRGKGAKRSRYRARNDQYSPSHTSHHAPRA